MTPRSRLGCLAAICLLTAVPLSRAEARSPPILPDPKEGVWIGAGEVFVHQSRDRWSVFKAPATVNKLAVDGLVVWIATDEGAIRFDTGSRKAVRFTMDDGLPSQSVSAVAVDDLYVWLATNKGLARYRKHDRQMRVYTDAEGLPHAAVNDALVVGRQVWFATRGGLAVYDPATDGLRPYTTEDGLGAESVEELYQAGDDLWGRTDAGLTRLRIKAKVFSNFTFEEIGGEEIRAFVLDGDKIWVGTENGLTSFETSSDAFVPFPQQSSLKGKGVAGIEPFTDYLFITTDEEVVQYHKLNRSIRRFTEAEGLTRQAGSTGTLLSGGLLTLMFEDGARVYDIQRDLWTARELKVTESDERSWGVRVYGKLNTEMPLDLYKPGPLKDRLGEERFATAEGGLGYGQRFEGGRTLDLSVPLDYGQLELPGIRDLQYRLEYLGTQDDLLREVRVEDKLKYRTLEEGLEPTLLLQGGKVRAATPGAEPALAVTAETGQRRGATVRDFITGPRKEIYELSKRWILPGSERVYLDGELLTNGTDYTVIYPAGQLAFLDPELVDDLSVIEIEYEYDLLPKKGLGTLSVLDLLPADKEVGDWTRSGQARLISEESGLYAQIDGAAPKYIDRGWSRSVYAEYRQGSRNIQVAIHDMASDTNALSLYDYDLPPAREPVADRENLVVDVGLATSYAAKAYTGTYFIELSIDEKSDAAKQSLKLFAIHILDREENAGQNVGGDVREWLAAARISSSPTSGLELGGRVVQLYGVGGDELELAPRRMLSGIADARYERSLGESGRLTAYSELAGTHGQNEGDPDGFAAMGRVRVSHPFLEGSVSGRHQSDGYLSLGSAATLHGRLRNEARAAVTGYPTRWLPLTAFYTRQHSAIPEENGGGTGVLQQALGRVQLNRDGLPGVSMQFGHTLLDGASETVNRTKLVGQLDYDLAQVLSFLHRFSVRGLYSLSQGQTDTGGAFTHADRVQLARLDVKFAPTATESAYALFRSRTVGRQTDPEGAFALGIYHWEVNAGARSAIVPGLMPQLNYSVLYDDDRVTTLDSVRSSKGSLSGTLGIYPGQWWSPLAAVVFEPRYSVANDEKAEGNLRTMFQRVHRFDNRAAYSGDGKLELELYELYEVAFAEADQHVTARNLELRNRLIYRPTFASPITLRLNYRLQKLLNDLEAMPEAPGFGQQATWEAIGEWLMRWNPKITTRLKSTWSLGLTQDQVNVDTLSKLATLQEYRQHRVGGEVELRLFPLEDAAQLFLIQRNRVFRLFGDGDGSAEAVAYDFAAGAIWTLGDNLYLDGEVAYRRTKCLGGTCVPAETIEPRVLLTFNL